MMISCEKAADFCNKKQYNEATWMQRMQLSFHLMICKACSGFSSKNTKLTELCSKATYHALPEAEKQKMKARLQEAGGN